MTNFLMILSSLILHEGGAKTGYSSSGEEALPSHFAALNRASETPLGSLGSASDRSGWNALVSEATGMSRVTITISRSSSGWNVHAYFKHCGLCILHISKCL
jgi:hypothetical protein